MNSETEIAGEKSGANEEASLPQLLRRSLHKIIGEDEFLGPLKTNVIPFLRFAAGISAGRVNLSGRFYFTLMNEAEKLETFLDDYGARENRTWNYMAELVASIRNFAIAAFHLSHVLSRYTDYNPSESEDSAEEFITHGLEALDSINLIVKDLIGRTLEELKKRGCLECAPDVKMISIKEIPKKLKLPSNIMMGRYKTSEQRILRIAESYRKIAIKINRDRYGKKLQPEDLAKMIPSRINETTVKILESTLHNIQSEYDTHIKKTSQESGDLTAFRAYISIPMHLLEMARWLIHFYERHEGRIHSDDSKVEIPAIADKDIVLKLISNFSFFYAHRYIMAGKQVAEKIMSQLVRKARVKAPVPKPAGFHARPSYYVTLVVEEHGTDVFMYVGKRKFDARSVLDLLEAGGMAADLKMEEVEFEGDERTLADLLLLAESNYCENGNIPKKLNYIRVARNIMT